MPFSFFPSQIHLDLCLSLECLLSYSVTSHPQSLSPKLITSLFLWFMTLSLEAERSNLKRQSGEQISIIQGVILPLVLG